MKGGRRRRRRRGGGGEEEDGERRRVGQIGGMNVWRYVQRVRTGRLDVRTSERTIGHVSTEHGRTGEHLIGYSAVKL